jgi:phosphoribosylanthranilate isomerase
MKLRLKVCGMRDQENILSVASLSPDYMGFIFYSKSPRYVGEEFATPVAFPHSIKRVGVFVDENIDRLQEIVLRHDLDYVQLHGQESVELCKEMKLSGIGVIKVFSIDRDFDFAETLPFKPYVDFFLFDTKGKYRGGNAVAFDWKVLENYDQDVPFFLSGGISIENVQGIKSLSQMNLHALDVNSGVEVSAGLKDINKIERIKLQMKDIMIDSD